MTIIYLLLVGLVAGWLAGQIMKGGSYGLIGNIIVGILGAILGGYLFVELGLPLPPGTLGSIICATVGAVLLLFVLSLIDKKR